MKSNYIKLLSLFLLIVIVFSYTSVFAATTFDNFDSYSDGVLPGQGGWTGDGSCAACVQIQGSVVQGGAKAVFRANGGGSPNETVQSISPALTTDLTIFSSYIRMATANDAGGGAVEVRYYNGSTELYSTKFDQTNDTITLQGASSPTILASASANTWYHMEIEFNFTAHTARARVDGGTWTSSIADIGSDSFTQVNKIAIQYGGITGTGGYIDTMDYTAPVTPASTVIKRGSLATIIRGIFTTFRK